MADVELLPLPEKVEVDKHLPTGVVIYGYSHDTMRDYACANVEHHTAPLRAEIARLTEALEFQSALKKNLLPYQNEAVASRAEIEELREQLDWAVKENDRLLAEGSELTARAEQLAEALEQAVTSMQDSGYPNSHVAVRAARAAIDAARGKDNG